jgi:hypothetical protein
MDWFRLTVRPTLVAAAAGAVVVAAAVEIEAAAACTVVASVPVVVGAWRLASAPAAVAAEARLAVASTLLAALAIAALASELVATPSAAATVAVVADATTLPWNAQRSENYQRIRAYLHCLLIRLLLIGIKSRELRLHELQPWLELLRAVEVDKREGVRLLNLRPRFEGLVSNVAWK